MFIDNVLGIPGINPSLLPRLQESLELRDGRLENRLELEKELLTGELEGEEY